MLAGRHSLRLRLMHLQLAGRFSHPLLPLWQSLRGAHLTPAHLTPLPRLHCPTYLLQRPSRSAASRSKTSSTAKPGGAQGADPLSFAELHHLQAHANLRRQSTANTSHLLGAISGPDPAALFAAAAAEGAAVAAAAAAALAVQQPMPQGRRLSVVGGTDGGSSSWSQETGDSEESPEFTLRRTTARTAGTAAPLAMPATAAAAAAAGLALPPAQHHYLQPPAAAPNREQQVPTPAPAASTPAVQSIVLPEALLPLRLELPVAPAAGAADGQSPGEVRCYLMLAGMQKVPQQGAAVSSSAQGGSVPSTSAAGPRFVKQLQPPPR